jgi:hypothetical protein
MSAKKMDRRFVLGLVFLAIVAGLIYLSGKSAHQVAFKIKPITVHLNFTDTVKQRLADSGAALGVQAIVSDKEVTTSPLDATVLDHREQVIKPGQDTTQFEAKTLELEVPKSAEASMGSIDPTITFTVVTRLDQPAGNCIRCESPVTKLSALKEGDNQIELKCDGWLEMGVCVWQKQKQKQK